jgi:Flp pilus assembly protein TadG
MRLTEFLRRPRAVSRGQALVEFALVFPLFMLVLFGIIIIGLGVFFQQEIASAARDAARYAAVHTSTAVCPTVSTIDPRDYGALAPESYSDCDRPAEGWPKMTGVATSNLWAIPASDVSVVACWSGYTTPEGTPNALPQSPNEFVNCTMLATDGSQIHPQSKPAALACPITAAQVTDTASDLAYYSGTHYPTTVTVYTCFNWRPPMSGVLFMPDQVTLRGVATEVLQRQQ